MRLVLYKTIYIFLILLFSHSALAQLYIVKKNGKWGAIDLKGNQIISTDYEFVDYYQTEGLVLVRQNQKYGLFDEQGKRFLPIQYDQLFVKKEGYLLYLKDGKYGLMSPERLNLLDPKFDHISRLGSNFFKTTLNKRYGLIKKDGGVVLESIYQKIQVVNKFILFQQKNLWGLIDEHGKIIAEASFENISFEKNYIVATKPNKSLIVFEIKENETRIPITFINQVAWNLKKKKEKKEREKQAIIQNPNLKKPRWQQEGLYYKLVNGLGKPLLEENFFDVISDKDNIYALARKGDKEAKKITCFYIQSAQNKVVWKVDAKFVLLSDFEINTWARLAIDTLFDGFIHQSDGRIKRTVKYQNQEISLKNIGNFKNGLAWVYDGQKYGYINKDLILVIPFIFDKAADFENNLAVVSYKKKYGCIDKNGKTALPFEYYGITSPSENLVCVKNARGREGKWGAVNLKNEIIIPFNYTALLPFKNGTAKAQKDYNYWGIIDKNNQEIVPIQITCSKLGNFIGNFKNGIAPIYNISKGKKQDKKTKGYANTKGKIIIPAEYDVIENFDSIWTLKKGLVKIWKGQYYGYVDYKGRIIVDAIFSNLEDFDQNWGKNEKVTRAKIDQLYGLLDHNGDTLLPFIYCFIDDNFKKVWKKQSGLVKACLYDFYGYFNVKAKEKISFNYDYISDIYHGYALVNKKNNWGIIDTLEDVSLTLNYDNIKIIPQSNNKLVRLLKTIPTYYYYDKNGRVKRFVSVEKAPALKPKEDSKDLYSPNYDHITPFDQQGLAVIKNAKKDNLRAIISKNGQLKTKFIYRDLGAFHENLAFAKSYNKKDKTAQKYGYINREGQTVIDFQYTAAQDFHEGLAGVALFGKWGYINAQNQKIIPFKYNHVTPFKGAYAVVNHKKIIDKKGQIIGDLGTYKIKDYFQNERAIVENKGFQYHIRPDGKPAYQARYDEVTPFYGEIAFVKKGEIWELKRQDPFGEKELKFNKQQKIAYLKKYGTQRKDKNKYGDFFLDKSWEKIQNGKWKLINKEGQFLTDIVFDDIELTKEGIFRAKVSRLYGISKLDGTFITELDYPVVKQVSNGILKIESKNKIGYLRPNGTWLWEIQD